MEKDVILFDGVCNLCNGTVQEIIKRDQLGQFQYASLQSDFGQQFLQKNQLPEDDFESFVFLFPNGDFKTKSDAALEVMSKLGGTYSTLGSILRMIPKKIRDAVYAIIAQNRYRVFGKKDQCMIPRPEWKNRFLD